MILWSEWLHGNGEEVPFTPQHNSHNLYLSRSWQWAFSQWKNILAFQIPTFIGEQIPVTTAQVTSNIVGEPYRLLLLPPHCNLSLFEVMALSLSVLKLSNSYLFYNRIAWSQNLNLVLYFGCHMMTMKRTWAKQWMNTIMWI